MFSFLISKWERVWFFLVKPIRSRYMIIKSVILSGNVLYFCVGSYKGQMKTLYERVSADLLVSIVVEKGFWVLFFFSSSCQKVSFFQSNNWRKFYICHVLLISRGFLGDYLNYNECVIMCLPQTATHSVFLKRSRLQTFYKVDFLKFFIKFTES